MRAIAGMARSYNPTPWLIKASQAVKPLPPSAN
jgi:hypothetical protein